MNPEERDLLKRSLELSQENNRILRSLQRSARWSTIWGFVKLAFIVVPLVIGYVYFQPYFESLLKNYEAIQGFISPAPAATSTATFQRFLNTF